MEQKKIRIALVIKTDGLEYDDRVRKEILTVQKLYSNISFKIFVLLPDNKDIEGITSYGVPYHAYNLKSRDKYPSASKILEKSYEFHRVIKNELKSFDAVWCADLGSFMTVALSGGKPLLWDLHELPMELMGSFPKKMILRYLFNKCKIIVHANPQRMNFLYKQGCINNISKHFSIRNYPNFDDVDDKFDDKYHAFIEWKGKKRCIYLQGLDAERRAAYESICAVMQTNDDVAVVVGPFDEKSKARLVEEYGDALYQRIYFVGKVPQLKIPQYVKLCYTTLVFYKNTSPNNYYCEANRFYQSVLMGLPVVVGSNPPMKELVEKYGFGVSIDDDGGSIQKIIEGLNKVNKNYENYRQNVNKYKDFLLWNNQESDIKGIIEALFK